MTTALYLVGPPGVGKTTLARSLLGIAPNGELPLGGFLVKSPKWTVLPKAVAAGHYTGHMFDGADMVPAPQYQKALDYWAAELRDSKPFTLLDGDRFSHPNALAFVRERATVVVAHLWADEEIHAARRALRGSVQNDSWVKGRVTKAANFAKHAEDLGHVVVSLNAGQMRPEEMRGRLAEIPWLSELFA